MKVLHLSFTASFSKENQAYKWSLMWPKENTGLAAFSAKKEKKERCER